MWFVVSGVVCCWWCGLLLVVWFVVVVVYCYCGSLLFLFSAIEESKCEKISNLEFTNPRRRESQKENVSK